MKRCFISCVFLFFQVSIFGQDISLMTYNIRLDVVSDGENAWPNRKDYFIGQLKFYEPDIIGFQEVTPGQLADIVIGLPDYKYVGKGRELNNLGESSNIFYKKKRFVLKDSGTFWLSESPDQVSMGWDAACNRVCTYVLLLDTKKKKQFYVFNTHLDHIGELARTNGIKLILEKIKAINIKDYPVFLMGDFNSTPDTERIKYLSTVMPNTRNISKSPSFGPSGTFNGFKHHEAVTREIDYIFMSGNSPYEVLKHAVLSDSKDMKYPSDHFPVVIFVKY